MGPSLSDSVVRWSETATRLRSGYSAEKCFEDAMHNHTHTSDIGTCYEIDGPWPEARYLRTG